VSVLVWAGVALLGGAGAAARFLLDGAVSARARGNFPAGTLAVNLSGSLLLGVLAGAALRGDALLLAGTALLGAYTTFSTWMLESHRLGEAGRAHLLWANVAGSLVLGLAAAEAGRLLGGLL
jgi:fluoride exporter